jgi:hypothetical protein
MTMVTMAPGCPAASGTAARYWLVAAQQDEADRLRDVAQHGAEHRHVEEHVADDLVGELGRTRAAAAVGEPDHQHHRKAEDRPGDHRDCGVLKVGW